jgi:hypothetical protein
MQRLAISWRDWLTALLVFAVATAFFVVFSKFEGWPNVHDGWSLALPIAFGVGAAPLAARLLVFLVASRASFEAFGVKFNLPAAVQNSEAAFASLPSGVIQQGVLMPESSSGALEQAAQEAFRHQVLVIDLEDGKAWYLTRLFALAATAEFLGSPSLLVLVGQSGGRQKQAGGSIAPSDLVRAVTQKDARYARALRNAKAYLRLLRTNSPPPPVAPGAVPGRTPVFARFGQYQYVYEEVGEALFMRVLVEELKWPDLNVLGPAEAPPEAEGNPPWITLPELLALAAPWIQKDVVELTDPPKTQIKAILDAKSDCVLAVRNGTFEGLVEVDRAVRQVVLQLIERSATPT